MQGRMIGSSRTPLGPRYVAPPGAAVPSHDVISFGTRVGRDHGSRPALVRSLVAMSILAAGLGALVARGGDLSAVGIGAAVASSSAAMPLPMPKPRIQLVASAILPAAPTVLTSSSAFAPIHDLDTEIGSNAVDRVSYDYLLTESAIGDPNDILEFGPMKIRRHLVQKIVRAAQAVQTDPVLLMAVADKESSFITEVQAKTSSATGLYQFIERTWLGVMRDFGAEIRPGPGCRPRRVGRERPPERRRPGRAQPHPRAAPRPLPVGPDGRRDAQARRLAHRPADRTRPHPRRSLPRALPRRRTTRRISWPRSPTSPRPPRRRCCPDRRGPTARSSSPPSGVARRRRASRWPRSTGNSSPMMSTRGARYRDVRSVAGILAYADATVE